MKKILIIGSIVIAVALGILLFATVYQPKVKVGSVVTPTPFVETPEPPPSPTPEIEILEDKNEEIFLLLEFYSLMDIMTTSQYNYVMISTTEFFNSLYQANIRNYPFEQYKLLYTELLSSRFAFSDDELVVPFTRFKDVFIDHEQEYIFVLDETSFETEGAYYKYSVDFYINNEKAATFDFVVNKDSSLIKIK